MPTTVAVSIEDTGDRRGSPSGRGSVSLKSRTRRSAAKVRPASSLRRPRTGRTWCAPMLPFNLSAPVMSPEPSPSSAGPPMRRVYSSWLKSDGVVNSKMPWFSVKNGPLVADEGFGGIEVHDEIVALDLAEIRIHRGGQLHLAVGFPEQVDAGIALAVAVDVVVETGDERRHREQRLAVSWPLRSARSRTGNRGRSKLASGHAARSPVVPMTRSR